MPRIACLTKILFAVLLLPPGTLLAQDQMEYIGGPRGALNGDTIQIIRGRHDDELQNDRELHAHLKMLIRDKLEPTPPANGRRTTPAGQGRTARSWQTGALPANGSEPADPGFPCIVHIVEWEAGKLQVKDQRWLLYRPGAPVSEIDSLRIYGARRIGLLYLHIGQGVPDGEEIVTENGEPANAIEKDMFVTLDGVRILRDGFARVSYRVDVTKKLPAPVADLAALAGEFQAGARPLRLKTVGVWGGRVMEIRHVPSDVTSRLLVPANLSRSEVAKQTYDNEGRYFWDVSVGMPVTKVDQLKLDFENGVVTAKKIERPGLMAMFNFFPRPIDTKGVRPSFVPHALVGVGLSKKPLDTIFVGAGIGLNKAQVFAGYALTRMEEGVRGGETASAEAADRVRRFYDGKFMAGINIPVKQVVEALK